MLYKPKMALHEMKPISDSKDGFKISHGLSVRDPILPLQSPAIKQVFIIIAHRKGSPEHVQDAEVLKHMECHCSSGGDCLARRHIHCRNHSHDIA